MHTYPTATAPRLDRVGTSASVRHDARRERAAAWQADYDAERAERAAERQLARLHAAQARPSGLRRLARLVAL
jgi:hypothetical protein